MVVSCISGTAMASTGVDSTLYGTDSIASGAYSNAFGYKNTASGESATAIGAQNTASGNNAFAAGVSSTASGAESLAIGKTASATSGMSLAVGTNAKAAGANSVAVGSGAGNSGPLWFASSINSSRSVVNTLKTVNYATTAEGDNAVALGFYANAKNSGVAVGQNALAATGGVAIGKGVFEDTNNNLAGGVAIGQDSASTGINSLAIGRHAFAAGSTSMAIGYEASANGNFAVAMGRNVTANGTSTAIGRNATASNGGLAIGSQDNDASSDITTASAKGAVAIGKNTTASSKDTVAIGTNAKATIDNSVALGNYAKTNDVVGTSSIAINGETHTFAGGTPVGTVSIGDVDKERTITNVAAGRIDATSTDAINGSQLNAVINSLNFPTVVDGDNTTVTESTNINGGKEYQVNLNKNLTNMNSAVFKDTSTSWSDFNHLTSIPMMTHLDKRGETKIDGSVIELHNTAVNGEDEQLTVIDGKHISFNKSGDYKTSVDVDGISTIHQDQGMSAYAGGIEVWGHENGDDNTDIREMSFTVSKVDVGGQQIHGVSDGEADTDAVNVSQLKKVEEKINDVETEAKKHTTVVAGNNITTSESTNATGGKEYTVSLKNDISGLSSIEVGTGANNSSVRINQDGMYMASYSGGHYSDSSITISNGVIDMDSLGTNIRLDNDGIKVATNDTSSVFGHNGIILGNSDGKYMEFSYDRVDVGNQQVHNVVAGTAGTDAVNVSQLKEVESKITNINQNVINQANQYTDSQVAQVGAQSAALAGLHPLDFNKDDKASYAASVGHYRNANAVAVGAFYRPNERTMVSGAISFGKHAQMNLGVAFKTGKGSEYINEAKSKDSRIEKLEALVNKLTAEVEELKTNK